MLSISAIQSKAVKVIVIFSIVIDSVSPKFMQIYLCVFLLLFVICYFDCVGICYCVCISVVEMPSRADCVMME